MTFGKLFYHDYFPTACKRGKHYVFYFLHIWQELVILLRLVLDICEVAVK